jgi:hypothetical protein
MNNSDKKRDCIIKHINGLNRKKKVSVEDRKERRTIVSQMRRHCQSHQSIQYSVLITTEWGARGQVPILSRHSGLACLLEELLHSRVLELRYLTTWVSLVVIFGDS